MMETNKNSSEHVGAQSIIYNLPLEIWARNRQLLINTRPYCYFEFFFFCPIFIFVLFPLRLLNRRLLQCNVYAFMWGCAPAAGRDRLLCMDLQGFGATASAALLTVYLTVLNMLVHNCPWGERWCLRAFVSIWVWMKTRSTAKIVCSKWMCGEQNSQINH